MHLNGSLGHGANVVGLASTRGIRSFCGERTIKRGALHQRPRSAGYASGEALLLVAGPGHETGPGSLLPSGGGGSARGNSGSPYCAETFRERGGGRGVLSEACAGAAADVASNRDAVVSV